jgi:hypothetical protein
MVITQQPEIKKTPLGTVLISMGMVCSVICSQARNFQFTAKSQRRETYL